MQKTPLTLTAALVAVSTLAVLSTAAHAAAAASSGPTSTVVYVGGNDLVLKASDGKLLNYTIPSGYHFAAGAKQLSLAELKPGTSLTKPVAPGSDPQIVSSVDVVKGKVYASAPPNALTLSLTEGVKELSVPSGATFVVGGKPMSIADLKPDMMVEATVVTVGDTPAAAAPSTPPMSGTLLVAKAASADGDLPPSGTNLPLIGSVGLGFLAAGVALLNFRKPARQA